MDIRKFKLAIVYLVVFVISVVVVLFLFVQILFQIPALSEPLVKAGITRTELLLDTLGNPIPVEKQLAYEKNEGDTFYSGTDKLEKYQFYGMFIVSPALLLTALVIGVTKSIRMRRAWRKYIQKDTILKNEYFGKYPLPPNHHKIACTDVLHYNPDIVQPSLYLWFENQFIHIINFDYRNDIGKKMISLNDISYFCRYGDFFTSTNVYEKSPSFGTTVAGALIGGGVGAVIASQGVITSSTKVHDNRETILKVEEEGQEKYLFFDPNAYNVFMHQIPDKEIQHVSRSGNNLVDKLAKLGELKEKGFISEEEFNKLKADLLNSNAS
jgi:uncharacterized membrane protein